MQTNNPHEPPENEPASDRKTGGQLIWIFGLTFLIIVSLFAFEFSTGKFGLFDHSLEEARAAVSIGEIDLAKQKYKQYIVRNLDDQAVRIEYIKLMIRENELDSLLLVAKELVTNFPGVENIAIYLEALQKLHDTRVLDALEAIDAGDFNQFNNAVDTAQSSLAQVPQVVFGELALEAGSLMSSGIDLPMYPRYINTTEYMNQNRLPVRIYLNFDLYKETIGFTVFGQYPSHSKDPSYLVSKIQRAFDRDYLNSHFPSGSLREMVEIFAAGHLRELSDVATSPDIANGLLVECSNLMSSGGLLELGTSRDNRINVFVSCQTRLLDKALETLSAGEIRKASSDWRIGANMLCGAFNTECLDKTNKLRSTEETPDQYVSRYVESKYSTPEGSKAFGHDKWSLAEKLYRQKAELLEEFLIDERKSSNSGIIAELRYNAAIALWNDEKQKEAIAALEKIQASYPDYTFGEEEESFSTTIAGFQEKAKWTDRYSKLAQHRKIQSEAEQLYDEDKFSESAKKFEDSASEYKRVTGDVSFYDLILGASSANSADNFGKAKRLMREACSPPPGNWEERCEVRTPGIAYDEAQSRASKSFAAKGWVAAYTNYLETAEAALKYEVARKKWGKEPAELVEESLYNAAMALMNDEKYRRSASLLRKIQNEFPKYNSLKIQEHLRDISNACPNRYLGC